MARIWWARHGQNTELCARLRHAMVTVASMPGHPISLIVAHGASLRAALPALTGTADPGSDLAPGAVASFELSTNRHGLVSAF
jgi:broad specificity phosphatase PhoE